MAQGFGWGKNVSSGFDPSGDALNQILIGLAMIDAGRPQLNPPPLMQLLGPMMQMQSKRADRKFLQDAYANFGEAVKNAPTLDGADDDVPSVAPMGMGPGTSLMGQIPPQGGPVTYPSTGSSQLSAGGALPKFLSLTRQLESGNRNILQQVVPPGGGYNPSVGRVTGPSSAGGYYQITDTTWKNFAPGAGVDITKYPTAMSAPPGVQDTVAAHIATTDGVQHWTNYNPRLKAALRAAGLPVSGPIRMPADDGRDRVITAQDNPTAEELPSLTQIANGPASPGGIRYAQAAPETAGPMTDAGTVPRQMAQSRLMTPQAPPPSPDSVSGKPSQRAAAMRFHDYWGRQMLQAGTLGDAGRGMMEYAKSQMDLAKEYLTAEQKKRLDAKWLPYELAVKQQSRYGDPEFNMELQTGIAGSQEAAKTQAAINARLRAQGLTPGTPAAQAWIRQQEDKRPEGIRLADEAYPSDPEQRRQAIAESMSGGAADAAEKRYRAYAAEEISAGRQPKSREQFWTDQNRSSATSIMTQPGEDAARRMAMFETDKPVVIEAQKRALQAQSTLPLLEEMIRLAPVTPEGWAGPASARLAQLASGFGLPVTPGMSNAELMRSMTQRFVPIVREPGATSEKELRMYLEAAPGLWQSADGRRKVAEMTKALAQHSIRLAEVYREQQGSPQLYAKLAEIENRPLFTDEQRATIEAELQRQGQSGPPAPATGQSTAQSPGRAAPMPMRAPRDGIGPPIPAPRTERERDSLPSGTPYVDPHGVQRIRP